MRTIYGKQQQDEIKTIQKRTVELKLSDADVERISQKAGDVGLTVAELIENFIGDLVCGTYSNGSDERMYAEQWFERCWFGMFPDYTFLRYLAERGEINDVLELWDDIQSGKADIADMESHPEAYDVDELPAMREEVGYLQEELNNCWEEYEKQDKEYKSGTFEEEIQKALRWREEYRKFRGCGWQESAAVDTLEHEIEFEKE